MPESCGSESCESDCKTFANHGTLPGETPIKQILDGPGADSGDKGNSDHVVRSVLELCTGDDVSDEPTHTAHISLGKSDADASGNSGQHDCGRTSSGKGGRPGSEKTLTRARSSTGTKPQLTPEEVLEIYRKRPKFNHQDNFRRGSLLQCKLIAPKYDVTPKTIR